MAEKTKIVIESFTGEDMGGGFFWWLDTPEHRDEAVATAKQDSEDYSNVIVVAFALDLPDDFMPDDLTEMLDAELVFEAGQAGEILYRSPAWIDGGDNRD